MTNCKRLIWLVMFMAGADVGFVACKAFAPKTAETGVKTEKSVVSEDAEKLAKAQKRIAELEMRLAVAKAAKKSRDDAASGKESRGVVVNSEAGLQESPRKTPSEDELKVAANVMSAIKAKLADKARSKIDFLRSVDVSHMSEGERKDYESFLELSERREAAVAKMKGGIPDAGVLQEVVMLGMQMTPAAKKVRSALAREAARELGYVGDDVDVVHDVMQNIYDATAPEGIDALVDAAKDAAMSANGVDVKVKTGATAK